MRKDAESPPSKLGIVWAGGVAPVTQRDHPNSFCLRSSYPRYSPSAMRTAKSAASASAAAGAAAVGAPRAS